MFMVCADVGRRLCRWCRVWYEVVGFYSMWWSISGEVVEWVLGSWDEGMKPIFLETNSHIKLWLLVSFWKTTAWLGHSMRTDTWDMNTKFILPMCQPIVYIIIIVCSNHMTKKFTQNATNQVAVSEPIFLFNIRQSNYNNNIRILISFYA